MVKLNLKGIKAAIFDLDGTMVNNQEFHKRAWTLTLKNHGLLIDDKFYRTRISGGKNDTILKKIFPGINADDIKKIVKEKEDAYHSLYKKEVVEVSGLTELIKNLKEKRLMLAIATTAPVLNRDFILEALNVKNYFDVIVGDEDVKNAKPNPEIYIKTSAKLRVKPEDCLVFEDSPSGIAAAKNARVKIIIGVLTYHSVKDIQSANSLIKDFTEIELN